ncbi:MAG: phage tail tape measure protein [Rhodoferax sp.]
MAENMRLRVVLELAERVLAPLKHIGAGSRDAANALKAARDRLKELNGQQGALDNLQRQQAAFAKSSNQLKVNSALLESARRSGTATTEQIRTQEKAVLKQAAALDQQRSKLVQLRSALSSMGVVGNLSTAQARLKSEIAAANGAIDAQKGKLKSLAQQHEKLAALKAKHASDMMHVGMAVGAGYAMQAVGQRGVQAGMGPVRDFSKHEDAMLGIARQVPGARNEMGKLTEVYRQAERDVRALSGQIPLATTQITEMMTASARMEVPTDKLKEFTLLASQMATAFDAVPDQITESMGKVAKNFKIPLTDIRGLADSINYLDDNAISKGADIIDFLNRTSGVVSTVAMRAQDAAALGSTLLTLGERAESASTAANAIVQKFAAATKGTKKFKSAMQELGLSTDAVQSGMSTDATATLSKVIEAIGKLPESKRIGVMVELVGMEHSDTLAKLVDKPEELIRQRKLANGGEAKGSMAREAAARNATLSAQWQMTKNRAFNLSAVVGESLAPALVSLLTVVNPLIERFGNWVQANPVLVGWVMKLAIGGAALVAVLGTLLIPVALVAGKIMLLRFVFSRLAIGLLGTQAAAGAVSTGMGLLYRAGYAAGRVFAFLLPILASVGRGILILGRFLLMTPLGIALALIATAAYLIWRNWDGIKGGLMAIWTQLSTAASAWWASASAGAQALWQDLVTLKDRFFSAGADLMSGLVNGITSRLTAVREAVVGAADAVGAWFREKLGIASPSRVFMEYGGWISEGAALGITGGQGAVRNAALAMATAATAAMPAMADETALRMDSRPPLSAPMQGAQPAAQGGASYNITINAAPGMDVQALARAVSAELDRRERAGRSRVLSSLGDID